MSSEPPEAPELDVVALLLQALPFIALPGPPRWLALPAPKYAKTRVESVVLRGAAPAPPSAPTPAPTPTPTHAAQSVTLATGAPARAEPRLVEAPAAPRGAFPTPPPITSVQPQVGGAAADDDDDALEPSPWDTGFDPPKDAIGTDPTALGPDPRSLSRNRPKRVKGSTAPALRTAPPPPPPKKAGPPEAPTHDILILPQNPTFKTAEQGVNAVLTYLRTAQFFALRARRDLPDETVFELAPDVFVHQLFTEGMAPAGPPSVLEATLRVSKAPVATPFGPAGRKTCFSLALVGCRYRQVSEAFKARLHQIVFLRPEQHPLPHDPARLRSTQAAPPQPIPAFDVQEVDRG